MSAEIVLVPHTHWDREWYQPFQVFRLRLVDVIDDVISRAEADPDFRFTLDGQMAAVDDYLEIRPENRERVANLVRSGQLAVGPWQILLDEFLCSGETIVRNLEMGWRGALQLGGAMPVGYLPDMFGHCAQMPQILAKAGLEHACLWRGVPAEVQDHAFRWEAPDGSAVRVEYLFDGYGNALDLFAVPEKLADATLRYRDRTRPWYGDDPVLGMLGSDHSAPRADLMDLVNGLGRNGLQVAGLTEYISRFRADDHRLPLVVGEMRSHARGNILPGVISIRVGLKQAMARAERAVGQAEGLAARSTASFDRFFELAWRRIIECSAHDSVTGCGVDETADQVAARLGEAAHIGRAVRDRVLDDLAASVPADAHLVVNTLPWVRTPLVELDVPAPDQAPASAVLADGTPVPVQDLGGTETILGDEKMPATDLERVLRRIHGRELFGQQIESYRVRPGSLEFTVAHVPRTATFDLAELSSVLKAAAQAATGEWRVRTTAQPRRRMLAAVPLAASGQVSVRTGHESSTATGASSVAVAERVLDSGTVRVEVVDDGTLTVRGVDGTTLRRVGRLVSGGDRGDSYNYGPPGNDVLVDELKAVDVSVVEAGPLRGVLEIVRYYDWPVSMSSDPDMRSEVTERVAVTTLVELRIGEPFVRLSVSFVNPSRDHRVRLHVPLPSPVTESHADGQFAVTGRALTAEGGWGEFPLPTFPASSFVSAGDATVLLNHVTEYELVGEGSELALTLLRAVARMSVNVHPHRDEPAGAEFAVPGAQRVGQLTEARLGILPHSGGWAAANAVQHAEEFRNDALCVRGRAGPGGALPESTAGLSVSGADVAVSSIRPRDDGVEVRLVAMSDSATTARITGTFIHARRTDLLGRPVDELDADEGVADLHLSPWEIATLRLT